MILAHIKNVVVEGIDLKDAPDYVDAFIASATWEDGTPLDQDELDELNEDGDFVYNKLMEQLY